ncbi:MAG: GGDEF domain-containing protein [Lachnospiraceae bacterium]|nr:GGDEF domain-containing protein [Lachnospiraceae bacterium]
MNIGTISADIVAAVFTLILLVGSLRQVKKNHFSTNLFIGMLAVAIVGMVCDAISYLVEGKAGAGTIGFWTATITYLACAILLAMYSLYLIAVLSERVEVSYRIIAPVLVLSGINFVQLLLGIALGKTFTIVRDVYVGGPWEDVSSMLSVIGLIYLYLVMFRFRKNLGNRLFLALCTYPVFPLIVLLIQLIIVDVDYTYVGIASSCLVIFVEVQIRTIAESELREQILQEVSLMDSLTGLKNRRAFNAMLREKEQSGKVAAVFCDLNSLKCTNDDLGHEAGDHLLVKFADMLREIFPDGEICRISGDEFVVLFYDMEEEMLDRKVQQLRDLINQNDRIASLGYVYRESGSVQEILREAELLMYEDKAKYYRETGKDRRH